MRKQNNCYYHSNLIKVVHKNYAGMKPETKQKLLSGGIFLLMGQCGSAMRRKI
jgi:hypothetical protein